MKQHIVLSTNYNSIALVEHTSTESNGIVAPSQDVEKASIECAKIKENYASHKKVPIEEKKYTKEGETLGLVIKLTTKEITQVTEDSEVTKKALTSK